MTSYVETLPSHETILYLTDGLDDEVVHLLLEVFVSRYISGTLDEKRAFNASYIYWYALAIIRKKVDHDNLTFDDFSDWWVTI